MATLCYIVDETKNDVKKWEKMDIGKLNLKIDKEKMWEERENESERKICECDVEVYRGEREDSKWKLDF